MLGEPNFIAEQNEQYPGFARAHAPYYWLDSIPKGTFTA